MTRRVLIVTHGGRPDAVAAVRDAVRELEAAGFVVSLHDDDLTEGFGTAGVPIDVVRSAERVEEVEIVLVLGGDGTILRAAELTHGTSVPLLGVNLGHVGFLAERDRDDLVDVVARLAAGDYAIEARQTVDVTVHHPGAVEPVHGWALNDATVEKAGRARMLEVAVEVDGRPLSSFGCDGVVMSTATGSTAHAFSAGGPVVWPDVDATILVPISAHALFARPIVVGPRSMLAVEIAPSSSSEGVLMCDGRRQIDLPVGSRVEVRRGTDAVLLARLASGPFTDRLVNKFRLPVVGWRGRRRDRDGGTE